MMDPYKGDDILEKFSVIHNYNISVEGSFRIFGPPKDYFGREPNSDCEVFIFNIPEESEEVFLAILLTFNSLYQVKFVTKLDSRKRGMAFVKFTNKLGAEKCIAKLKTATIHLHHNIHTQSCALYGKQLYLGNINISRFPMYKMEQILLNIVIGLNTYIVYSLDKHNRYIINLVFFTIEDLLLSIQNICKYELFAQSPDIFIDTEPPVRIMESIPICNFTYKSSHENHAWPNEISISSKKYNELKIF